MNKKLLFSLIFVASITLQGFATPAYASGPTGTVTYNGQNVQVTDGQFTLNGVAGTIDAQGNYSWAGNTGNILSTSGVTGYQITGQAPIAVTPTPNVPAPNTNPVVPNPAKAPSGTVMFNGQAIQVINGQFTLNGVAGTIDAQGNYSWNRNTGNILNLSGVTGYQITGQAPVAVTPNVSQIGQTTATSPWSYAMAGDINSVQFTPQQTQAIKDFFATNPTEEQIAAKISELGLNLDQAAKALEIGAGFDQNNKPQSWQTSAYIGRAINMHTRNGGMMTSMFTGSVVSLPKEYIQNFFATNPTPDQIAQIGANYHMSIEDFARFMQLGGKTATFDTLGTTNMVNNLSGYAWKDSYIVSGSGPKQDPTGSGYLVFVNNPGTSWQSNGNTTRPTTQPSSPSTANSATPGYDSNGNFIGLTAWLRAQNSSTSSSQPSTGNTAQVSDIDPLATSASSCANLTTSLRYGNKDTGTATDVTVLQDFLNSKGYLSIAPTGFFGRLTFNAVKAFQSANNITPSGFVGPITRAKIQSMDCTGTSATTAGANG